MARLDGKVALISGGARGQGAAEARLFTSEGARVVVGDVLDSDGEVLAKELGDSARYMHHDVTSEEEWAAIVEHTVSEFGRLDVLINNAGIFRFTPLTSTSADDYMTIIRVNQLGVFLGMKAVVDAMTAAGGGSIVNISSIAGLRGGPATVAYSASKWAVRGMTKCAALELAPRKIRVNSIHPGVIDTNMVRDDILAVNESIRDNLMRRIPLGYMAEADDVAKLALYLASDDSSYSTGAEFVVDGGMMA